MAEKAIKKKKINRKAKRRIRKTAAALLLISAIAVAAIPVPEASASGTNDKVEPEDHAHSVTSTLGDANTASNSSNEEYASAVIPYLTEDDTIYCTPDSRYRFAYVNTKGYDYRGILVGYTVQSLADGALTIPETLEAFVPYTTADGSNRGNAAANQDGKPLFYKTMTKVTKTYTKSDESETYTVNTDVDSGFVTETSTNASDYQPSISMVKDPDTLEETVTLICYRWQFFACKAESGSGTAITATQDAWNVDNVNYYLYDTSSQSADADNWMYYDLPNMSNYETIEKSFEDEVIRGSVYLSDVLSGTDGDGNYFTKANATEGWLHNVTIGCISNQRAVNIGNGIYQIDSSASSETKGFFTNAANIKSISLPDTLYAIADYSFLGCTNLESVTFTEESQLAVLGKNAFADCTKLSSVSLADNCALSIIGESAFENCRSLTGFVFPSNISKIGDNAFHNCQALATVDFTSNLSNVTEIGNNVFSNCTSLKNVVLPDTLKETGLGLFENCSVLETVTLPNNASFNTMYFSDFQGCSSSLKWIWVKNLNTKFDDTIGYPYDIEDFKESIGSKFYFIGRGESKIHDLTHDHEIAFLYDPDYDENNEKIYEIVKQSKEDGTTIYQTYQARALSDTTGELLNISIEPTNKDFAAEIPDYVGPYAITMIGSDFNGNTNITALIVPTTITSIADKAFQGCYNLEEVTFQEPNSISYIGEDAFDTQYGRQGTKITPLTFYGTIDITSLPFQYAMTPGNNINTSAQIETYIDFCSGSPTNIHVHYNSDTGYREVWQVPKTTDADYRQGIEDALDDSVSDNDTAVNDVINAYKQYSDGESASFPYSSSVLQAVAAAYDITLPTGIQAIAEGLFSEYSDETAAKEITNLANNGKFEENASATIPVSGVDTNTDIRSITMYDVEALDDYAFYGCEKLRSVSMCSSGVSDGESIGNYAFGQCENLSYVSLPTTTSGIGVRPFAGDTALSEVYFTGESPNGTQTAGENFSCEKEILYKLQNGNKSAVVECLETRGAGSTSVYIGSELSGISSLYPEAFMNCKYITTVDLASSEIDEIPEFCFDNAAQLAYVTLPISCASIGEYAFKDTALARFAVPYSSTIFDSTSFYSTDEENGHVINNVEVLTSEGSSTEKLAKTYSKYGWYPGEYTTTYFNISFYDDDDELILTRSAAAGEEVKDPTDEEMAEVYAKESHEGMYFVKWYPANYSPAGKDMTVTAIWDDTPAVTWTATFVNDDLSVIITRTVVDGEAAEEPKTPTSAYGDYYFTGWVASPSDMEMNNITGDVTFMAQYDHTKNSTGNSTSGNSTGTEDGTWTATFVNDNAVVLSTQSVADGAAATAPSTPTSAKGDYKFTGWSAVPSTIAISKITGNVIFMAQYDYTKTSAGAAVTGSSGSDSSSGDSSSDEDDDDEGDYYVRVIDGGGSGYYDEGDVVTIQAYDKDGYEFEKWMSTYEDLEFSTETSVKSGFLMPKSNVVVTATYKYVGTTDAATTTTTTPTTTTPAATTTTTSGTVTRVPSTSGGSSTNTGTTGSNNNGTTVQVNRNGISDTGKASATVNGSTDNFVVKVSEDGQTTAAVAEALKNKYGDLSDIRYFAMDISLYDETGASEITDTSGLSVTMTLPIPDELRQYAGNNKVGAVSSGNQLEELTPRFATVDGTPCVTFTASHFSPYTIYVDTANLSSGAYDSTPKTGDAIHPKWFLAAGLALLSAVLFLKKDKKASAQLA